METEAALEATQQQLEYWKGQRLIATREGRLERRTQCEKFIAQCELVIRFLEGERAAPD